MGIDEVISNISNENNSFSYIILRNLTEAKKKSFLTNLMNFGMDVAMISAPLLTYCFQINKFLQTHSSKGFSKLICLLLFLGNIFRIFFWFGKHFKKTLFYQSIGVVIFQVILIHLCVKYQDKALISQTNNISYDKPLIYYLINWKKTLEPKKIWKWAVEIEYYKFMSLIAFILTIFEFMIGRYKIYYDILGVFAAFFESMTCVPQAVNNCRTKNTRNISFQMIFFWFLGDSFRLYYYVRFKSPIQMIIGICIQVTLDFIVSAQICFYNRRNSVESKNIKVVPKNKVKAINNLMKKIDELNIIKSNQKNELDRIGSDESEGDKNSPKLDKTISAFPDINA